LYAVHIFGKLNSPINLTQCFSIGIPQNRGFREWLPGIPPKETEIA